MPKTLFKITPEVHLVLKRGDQYLLLRRYQTGYLDGFYGLVAGHVDGAEPFRTAMAREALEEAGIAIVPDDLRLVHMMHRLAEKERLSLFFEPTSWTGPIENREPHKCDDLDWYSLEEKDADLIPYIKAALDHIAAGDHYSEFGWSG